MNLPDRLDYNALNAVSTRTLGHYNEHADDFFSGTRDHDVTQNIDAMLQFVEVKGPASILDFGCGPGRDLKTFSALGHHAIGLDGAARFADMARVHSGCEVWLQDFFSLDLPTARFDAVFANASLFHVPSQSLHTVLADLHTTLKPRGVLFSSNPRGHNEEGWQQNRYATYYDWPRWRDCLTQAGFCELHHFYRPSGLPLEQQHWLASVWRRR